MIRLNSRHSPIAFNSAPSLSPIHRRHANYSMSAPPGGTAEGRDREANIKVKRNVAKPASADKQATL